MKTHQKKLQRKTVFFFKRGTEGQAGMSDPTTATASQFPTCTKTGL